MRDLSITVVIPTIPTRTDKLSRALDSVFAQTLPATAVVTATDTKREGAAKNRQRGLEMVNTDYVAFLDDDDYFMPHHLEALAETLVDEKADYVYSWYEMDGGTDPRPEVFGQPWDNENPVQTTITTLVRTDLARSVGFVNPHDAPLNSPDRLYAGEDWFFTKGCMEAGARIVHRPEKTWYWSHWGGNLSGLPRW